MNFSILDIIVFLFYCLLIISIAIWVSRRKKGEVQTTRDYFLAGNSLPWWAIGTSLIAANISAEQLIGMTGDGFTMGLAIASYEWMAALTLVVVGKYFLPIFLDKKIYSMPNFLEIRYGTEVRTILSILWLMLYVFVNLTSILYLGGVCIEQVFGVRLEIAIISIAVFSIIYTLSGGLKAIAYTDFIQVSFLVVGGLITTGLALNALSDGEGIWKGVSILLNENKEKFNMIFTPEEKYFSSLPGFWGVFVFLWIINLNYWGFNQYITQRALAAKNLNEAQKGVILAGFIKLLMPLIVVVPGIIAYALKAPINENTKDAVYPWLLNEFLTPGVKGIVFAALVAAIVGSLSSKTNSIATIFTMDIFKPFFGKQMSESQLVRVGRISILISLTIAVALAPYVRLFEGGFQFIQIFTGFFSPGIFVIFLFGLFWKKASKRGALWVAALTLPLSVLMYFFFGQTSYAIINLPFLFRIGISFILLALTMIYFGFRDNPTQSDPKAISYKVDMFKTSTRFNLGALIIFTIIVVIYAYFW
ncbi:MAG: sodium/solute symporter [Cytophagaceae bacterium]|nr:sodium/solute symporter [Cytophagaceae bacterium]MDW8456354.1 sodium/solute symporter [Cytophagaceae bacterium]